MTHDDETVTNVSMMLALGLLRERCDKMAEALADQVSGPSMAEWIAAGVVRGYVLGGPVCAQHDVIPYTDDEAAEIAAEDGDHDVVCPFVLRLAP